MQKGKLTAIGSVVAAIAASICCIGPLVAVTLGVGSLAAASGLQKWRPLFLGATFVLLGVAWYLTYRKPKAEACAEGTACAVGPGARGGKVVLWISTALAVALAALPLYAGAVARLLHRVTSAGVQPSENIAARDESSLAGFRRFGPQPLGY